MKLRFLISLLIIPCMILSFVLIKKTLAHPSKIENHTLKNVEVIGLKEKQLESFLSIPSMVKTKRNNLIKSEFQGLVSKISVSLGQKVKKGQNLMVLKRSDPLFQGNPTLVQSDMEGVVSQIDVKEGNHVNQGENLLNIIDSENLTLSIQMAPDDLSLLKLGQIGKFRLEDQDLRKEKKTKEISVKIIGISSYINPVTGTAQVELSLLERDQDIYPGLLGKVYLQTNSYRSFVVPADSLIYRGEETFINLVSQGIIHREAVSLGKTHEDDQVEIKGKIKEGSFLVTSTEEFLKEGEKVQYHVKKNL